MVDIIPYLERLRTRLEQPEMQAAFHGSPRTIQFIFPDLQRNFTLNITGDGNASLIEQTLPQPNVKVTINSDTLAGILDQTVNPVQAYLTRKIKVTGQLEDLLKLQKLL